MNNYLLYICLVLKNFRSWFARIFFYDFSLSPAHDIPWILSKTINPFKRDWAKTTTFFMFGIIFIFWNAAQTFLFGRMPWDFRTLTIGICQMLKKSQPGFSTYLKFPHYNYTFLGLKFSVGVSGKSKTLFYFFGHQNFCQKFKSG